MLAMTSEIIWIFYLYLQNVSQTPSFSSKHKNYYIYIRKSALFAFVSFWK